MRNRKGDIETNYEVRTFDAQMSPEEFSVLPRHPLYFVLDNLRSAFNVGAIFRLADTMRISSLFCCGYTAHPPHIKLEKTSLGTIPFVPWRHFETTAGALGWLQGQGIGVYAAETTSCSRRYSEQVYPQPVAIVFGNEALGVERQILDRCDGLIEIPTFGFKNSLNVATSAAVIGYRVLEQWGFEPIGPAQRMI